MIREDEHEKQEVSITIYYFYHSSIDSTYE